MKRILAVLVILVFLPGIVFGIGPAISADVSIAVGEPSVQAVRKYTVTGAGAISASVSISPSGTEIWELISWDLHLSAAGAAATLTVTKNAGSGAEFDALIDSTDMTTVTDILQTWDRDEFVLDKGDTLDFAWANGSNRTYGLTVLYRLK